MFSVSQPLTRRPPRVARAARNYKDPSKECLMKELREKAMALEALPVNNSKTLLELLAVLKAEREEMLAIGNGPESDTAHRAVEYVRGLANTALKTEARDSMRSEIKGQITRAHQIVHQLEVQIAGQEESMKSQFDTQMKRLKARHKMELNALYDEWAAPEKDRKYVRASNALKELRRQAELLLKERKYSESKKVEKMAEEMAQEEAEMRRMEMEEDFEKQLRNLQAAHAKQEDDLRIKQRVKTDEYQAAKQHDLRVANRRIAKLKIDKRAADDPDRVWTLHHRNDGDALYMVAREINTNKKVMQEGEFNTLNLPPLGSSRRVRCMVQTARRSSRREFY